MIRINLLPPELQKAARAPRNLFITFVVGAAVTTTVGVTLFWLWISVNGLHDEADRRQVELTIAEDKAREVDRINEDIALYKDREKAIIEIRSRRILWGLKMLQLVALTPPEIWITRIDMRTLEESEYKWDANKGPQTGGRLSLTCYALGTDATTLTSFRSQLSGNQRFYGDLIADDSAFPDNFFGDFARLAPHSWQQVALPGYVEPMNLHSVIDVDLKPLYPPPKAAKKKK